MNERSRLSLEHEKKVALLFITKHNQKLLIIGQNNGSEVSIWSFDLVKSNSTGTFTANQIEFNCQYVIKTSQKLTTYRTTTTSRPSAAEPRREAVKNFLSSSISVICFTAGCSSRNNTRRVGHSQMIILPDSAAMMYLS